MVYIILLFLVLIAFIYLPTKFLEKKIKAKKIELDLEEKELKRQKKIHVLDFILAMLIFCILSYVNINYLYLRDSKLVDINQNEVITNGILNMDMSSSVMGAIIKDKLEINPILAGISIGIQIVLGMVFAVVISNKTEKMVLYNSKVLRYFLLIIFCFVSIGVAILLNIGMFGVLTPVVLNKGLSVLAWIAMVIHLLTYTMVTVYKVIKD